MGLGRKRAARSAAASEPPSRLAYHPPSPSLTLVEGETRYSSPSLGLVHPPSTTAAPSSQRAASRLGRTAIVTIALATAVELATLGFLAFLWAGRGSNASGEGASSIWRSIVLGSYATRTVTLCALVLRTAVSFQATVATGLIAALLLEARDVDVANAAHFSILRAVPDGPVSVAWPLARTPAKYLRSAPAFAALVLFLGTIALQFSSTLLLSDFRQVALLMDPRSSPVPILESFPELAGLTGKYPIDPYLDTELFKIWRQPLNSYPPFAEAVTKEPLVGADLGDTGTVKRAILPFAGQERQKLRHYEGASIVYTSRVTCVRPTLRAAINISERRLVGSVSWQSHADDEGLDGLACGAPGSSCPPMAIDCFLPFLMSRFRDYSILDRPNPASICIFGTTEPFTIINNGTLVLVLSTNTAELSSIEATPLPLPRPTGSGEWTTFDFGQGQLALNATVCLTNYSTGIENVVLRGSADLSEPAMAYNASTKSWNTDQILKLLDVGGGGEGKAAASADERGIMTLAHASKTTNAELDRMYSASPNYNPLRHNESYSRGAAVSEDFLGSINIGVMDVFTPRSRQFNFSIQMCSLCVPRAMNNTDGSFNPHPYTVLLFHDVRQQSGGSAAHALHSTLFWLIQAQYYNTLPGFDMGGDSIATWSQEVSMPAASSGLTAVASILLLNLACFAAVAALFLRRTRHSAYGNAWQAVAQLVSPDTRELLDGATRATDWEVSALLRQAGLRNATAELRVHDSGRVALATGARLTGPEEGLESTLRKKAQPMSKGDVHVHTILVQTPAERR